MPTQVPKTRWGGIADGRFRPSWILSRRPKRRRVLAGRSRRRPLPVERRQHGTVRSGRRFKTATAFPTRKRAGRNMAAKTRGGWRRPAGSRAGGSIRSAPGPMKRSRPRRPCRWRSTPNLDLGMSFAWQKNDQSRSEPKQDFPDVFDPEFDTHIRRRARELCAKRSGEPGHHRLVHRQ